MKFYDLFCGIGGFRMGMEKNGHECVGSCEIDEYARQIYARNFGHEPEQRDVRELNPKELPDFQCLCAGFPCQSFSLAGNRRGFEDTRGTLFFEIIRIVREKQPPILFLENVKGLLSDDQGETYGVIQEALDEVGYDCEWFIVNSKYFVPQNRERVFIVGHLRGQSRREVFPLGEECKGDAKPHGTLYAEDECSSTLTATYWKGYGGGRPMIAEPKLKVLKNSNDDSYRIYSTDGVARSLRANSGGLGSKTGVYMVYKSNTNANMKQRVQKRDNTWTLTNNSGDFVLIDDCRIRKLTPTECERLQGFPDGWTEGISDTQRYKCLGNAVTATVIEYVGGFL